MSAKLWVFALDQILVEVGTISVKLAAIDC